MIQNEDGTWTLDEADPTLQRVMADIRRLIDTRDQERRHAAVFTTDNIGDPDNYVTAGMHNNPTYFGHHPEQHAHEEVWDAVVNQGSAHLGEAGIVATIAEVTPSAISIFIENAGDLSAITIASTDAVQRIQGKDADTTVLPVNVTINKDNVTIEQLGLSAVTLTLGNESPGTGLYPTVESLLVTADGQLLSVGGYDKISDIRFQNTTAAGLRFERTLNNNFYCGSEVISCRWSGSGVDIVGPSNHPGGTEYAIHDFKFIDPWFLQGDADYFISAGASRVNDVRVIGGSIYVEKDSTEIIQLAGKGHLVMGMKFNFGPGTTNSTAITLDDSTAAYHPASIQIIGNEISCAQAAPLFFDCLVTPKHILFALNTVNLVNSYGASGLPRFKGAENMDWIGNMLAGCTIDFDSKANQRVIGGDMTGCTLQNIPTDIVFRSVKGQADRGTYTGGTWAADLLPDADNTRDLGSAALSWNDAYIQGLLAGGFTVAQALLPDSDNARDIGSLAASWRDGLFGRSLAAFLDSQTLTGLQIGLRVGNGTITQDWASNLLYGLLLDPTIVYKQAGAVLLQYEGIASHATVKNDPAVSVDPGPGVAFGDGTIYQVDTATGRIMSVVRSVNAAPTVNRINSGTMTVTELTGMLHVPTIGAGITVTTRRGLWIFDVVNSGTVTTQVGVDIAALTAATTNIGIRNAAPYVATPSAAQTLAAGTAILANAEIVQINSAGAITSTAAPTIANGQDGQKLIIINVDSADAITLSDQGTLANSNLRLSTATYAMGPRDSLTLVYSASVGDWIEVGRTNVI